MKDNFEITQLVINWIKNIRNKYNLPKEKLVLYIDLYTKTPFILDINLITFEYVLVKPNFGNLERVEYDLINLFKDNHFFEATQIEGINFYIPITNVNKEEKSKEILIEIDRLEKQLNTINSKLNNTKFIEKASIEIVNLEKSKQVDISNKILKLKSILLQFECGKEYYDLLIHFGSEQRLKWHIEYIKELKLYADSTIDLYSEEWFDYVYNTEITCDEIKRLYTNVIQHN